MSDAILVTHPRQQRQQQQFKTNVRGCVWVCVCVCVCVCERANVFKCSIRMYRHTIKTSKSRHLFANAPPPTLHSSVFHWFFKIIFLSGSPYFYLFLSLSFSLFLFLSLSLSLIHTHTRVYIHTWTHAESERGACRSRRRFIVADNQCQ